MAAKKKTKPKKSTAKRPSVSRAKPSPKPCCGRLRGHAPDCQGETADPGGAPLEPIEAAAPAVAQDDAEAPQQPGPYLAALQSIAASLDALLAHLVSGAFAVAPAGPPPASQEAARRPRRPKEGPPAGEPAPAAPAAAQEPEKVAPPALHPCCGQPANGPHREGCPALVKAKLDALKQPDAPPAAPEKPVAAAQPASAAKPPTVEEVRSAFLSYASRNGRDAAVALLGRFSATKVAEIPAAQFPAFLGALKGEV